MSARTAARLAAALFAGAVAGCHVSGAMVGEMIGGGFALTDAQQVIADMKLGPSDLRVIGGVDHGDRRYRVGEPIALSVQVSKDANVAVLRVLANGMTTQLFPSKDRPSAALAANGTLRLDGIAADKPGTVLFEFIAATRADSFLFDRKRAEAGAHAELGSTTRALAKDIVLSLKPGPGRETAGAHLAVGVEAR